MKFSPRSYQIKAAEAGLAALRSGKSLAIVSPTGSGKSIILALMLEAEPALVLTVPTLEIGVSVYDKIHPEEDLRLQSEANQRAALGRARIVTVQEYRNRLMAAEAPPAKFLAHDELHHSSDDTHELIHALCGHCPRVGTTATYYRGTPDESAKLRALWGEPYVALTMLEARDQGIISVPSVSVWPLLNDDSLAVKNGEFDIRSTEGAIEKLLPDLVDRVRVDLYDIGAQRWKRPTMFTAPGVKSATAINIALRSAGCPAITVVGGTRERQGAFASVVDRTHAMVQVNVVSEGIDLPLRVSVDLSPTMSPVRFMQGRIGRITRPTDEQPQYVCTNHNVSRHSYLLAGLIPRSELRAAQQAWGPEWKPNRRHMARALGLEGFGKFVVSSVPLRDGTLLSLYALQTPDGLHQYSVLLLPDEADPYFFERTNVKSGEMAEKRLDDGRVVQYAIKDYGPWKRIKSIPSADGYVSVKPGVITPKMMDWWTRSAEGRGLDAGFMPDARQFTILPVLLNARIRFTE